MHVIEGWSHLLWQHLLPFLIDGKTFVQDIDKDIVGLIDSNKLLSGARIPCHCWRDIFKHPLLQNRLIFILIFHLLFFLTKS